MTATLHKMQRRDHDDGAVSHTRVVAGTVRGEVEITIDVDALFELLGPKALLSKGRRSRTCGGIIKAVARVIAVTHE